MAIEIEKRKEEKTRQWRLLYCPHFRNENWKKQQVTAIYFILGNNQFSCGVHCRLLLLLSQFNLLLSDPLPSLCLLKWENRNRRKRTFYSSFSFCLALWCLLLFLPHTSSYVHQGFSLSLSSGCIDYRSRVRIRRSSSTAHPRSVSNCSTRFIHSSQFWNGKPSLLFDATLLGGGGRRRPHHHHHQGINCIVVESGACVFSCSTGAR